MNKLTIPLVFFFFCLYCNNDKNISEKKFTEYFVIHYKKLPPEALCKSNAVR